MTGRLRLVDGDGEDPYEDLAGVDRATAGQRRAKRTGIDFMHEALEYVRTLGATVQDDRATIDEVTVARILGRNEQPYWLIGHGTFDDGSQAGLRRTDTMKKAIADAYLLSRKIDALPVVLITSHLPRHDRAASRQLATARGLFWDVVAINGDFAGYTRMKSHLHQSPPIRPTDVPWMSSIPTRGGLTGQLTFEADDDNGSGETDCGERHA